MSQLRGVAVGAGYFSQFHFEAWQRIEQVEMVAVCDRDARAAEAAAKELPKASAYSDFEQMLDTEQPDFVDIITRPDSHLALVRAAAARGIAILCQKPLTPSFEESQQLVRCAEEAGVRLMVHENFRFQPWYREIKRQIDSGAIGERLHSVGFRCRTGDGWSEDAYLDRQPYFRKMPRLLIFETGVHFVDTYRYLAGEVSAVFAQLKRWNEHIVGEDAGLVVFEFDSGAGGIWDANRYNEPTSPDARFTFGEALIEGCGGSLRLDGSGRLTLQPLGEPERELEYTCPRHSFAGDCVFTTQQHFVDALTRGEAFETSGAEYLRTLRVVEAIYDSAETSQRVVLGDAPPCA